jgi:hypothetical protein
VQYLARSASFHSDDEIAPSKPGIKHLARAVFAHSQGRISDRSEVAQQKRAMALNLVIAAITFWNTLYINKAANHLAKQALCLIQHC